MNNELNKTQIIINELVLVVTDDKHYTNLSYSSLITREEEVEEREQIFDLSGLPVCNIVFQDAIGIDPETQERKKIKIPIYLPIYEFKKVNKIIKLNNIHIKPDDPIRLDSEEFIEYFTKNPTIKVENKEFNVIEYQGWTPQVYSQQIDHSSNTQTMKLKIFIKN